MRAALARLYPQSWRDRYGDEFEAMLEEQPTTVASVADVLLGAVDAHLTKDSPENRGWWIGRLPGLLIAMGASVWAVAWGIRESHVSQDVTNVASMIAPIGEVAVGFGILTLPAAWTGASSRARLWNAGVALLFIVAASVGHALHLVAIGTTAAAVIERYLPGMVALQLLGSAVWAISMLTRVRSGSLAFTLLAMLSCLLIGMGRIGYAPDYDQTDLGVMVVWWALAWLGVGVSLMRSAPVARRAAV